MKTITIVVDSQTDFIDGVLGTKEAQKALPMLVKRVAEAEGDIIATKDTHDPDTYFETQEGKLLPVGHTFKGQKGWELAPELQAVLNTKKNVTVLTKNTFGTFELVHELQKRAKTTDGSDLRLVFVGFCTDICVVSNVLIVKAAFPEAKVIVYSDSCAGVTPEKHAAALETMKSCQVEVI